MKNILGLDCSLELLYNFALLSMNQNIFALRECEGFKLKV